MIYSNLYKEWIATCMKCGLALINFEASADNYHKNVVGIKYYDYEILKGCFIINADMLKVRSSCGKCNNKKCKAYLKNQ